MTELEAFLQRYEPQDQEITVWGGGQFPLRVTCYFCEELPPLALVTSVRAIVLQGDQVLVLRNQDELHLFPGGRREAGEQLHETLQREILEETGWLIATVGVLGVAHFHHLTPKPPDFPYLHPDFLHLIYLAQAIKLVPEAKLPDDYELESRFMPIAETMRLPFKQSSQIKFLAHALAKRVL